MARVKRGDRPGTSSRGKAPAAEAPAGNEDGMALVLALVMLALLTILGAWAVGTSSTDLMIVDNIRNTQHAFYSADAALAYATNPETLTKAYVYSLATGSTAIWSEVISIGTCTVIATVNYLGSGPLPAGSLYDGDLDESGNPRFHGHYFAVNTEAKSAHNAAVAVEAAVVQVLNENVCGGGICASTAAAVEQVLTLYWRQR